MFDQDLIDKLNDLKELSNKKTIQERRLNEKSINFNLNEAFDEIFTGFGLRKLRELTYEYKFNPQYESSQNLKIEVKKEIIDRHEDIALKLQVNAFVGHFTNSTSIYVFYEDNSYYIKTKEDGVKVKKQIHRNDMVEILSKELGNTLEIS